MFERFTQSARFAVIRAQEFAREHRAGRIGTQHLLLAIADGSDSLARRILLAAGATREQIEQDLLDFLDSPPSPADALATLGIDLDEVRRRAEEAFGPGALDRTRAASNRGLGRGHIPFAPRVKKVLELALREALALKHNWIGTEHILLALLREGEGTAAAVLQKHRVTYTETRAAIIADTRRTGTAG